MPANTSFTFRTRGLTLASRKWLPSSSPRAAVIFVHGWGDHAARYEHVASVLARQGYAVYSFDFEGHGHSPGPRAVVAKFASLIDDVDAFVKFVRGEIGNIPLFLSGYSMGGCAVATYVAFRSHDIAGAIFNASALIVSKDISGTKKFLARMLGSTLPNLKIFDLTAGELMTRDPVEISAYENDPLIYHGKIAMGTGKQILLANEHIGKHLNRITLPFLVLQGTADALVDPDGAKAVYERSPSPDKTIQLYEGARHELLHETNRDEVVEHLTSWLNARCVGR